MFRPWQSDPTDLDRESMLSSEERISVFSKVWRFIAKRKGSIERSAALKFQRKSASGGGVSTGKPSPERGEANQGKGGPELGKSEASHGLMCTCGSFSCGGSLIMQYTLAVEQGDVEKCRLIRQGLPTQDSRVDQGKADVQGGASPPLSVKRGSRERTMGRDVPSAESMTSKMQAEPSGISRGKPSHLGESPRLTSGPILPLLHQPTLAGVPQIGFLSGRPISSPSKGQTFERRVPKPQHTSYHEGSLVENVPQQTEIDKSLSSEWLHENLNSLHLKSATERENIQNYAQQQDWHVDLRLPYEVGENTKSERPPPIPVHYASDDEVLAHTQKSKRKRKRTLSLGAIRHVFLSHRQYSYQKVKTSSSKKTYRKSKSVPNDRDVPRLSF